jgi:hypothetical protein
MAKKVTLVVLKDEGPDENSGVMVGPAWLVYNDGTQENVNPGNWTKYPAAKALAKKLKVPFETV